MNKKFRLYLLISCALHGAIILLLYLIAGNAVIPTNFLVLGAHSKEHLETLYKPMGHVVPFIPIHMRPQTKPITTTGTQEPDKESHPTLRKTTAEKPAIKEKSHQQKKTTLEQAQKKPLVPQKKQLKIAQQEDKKIPEIKPIKKTNKEQRETQKNLTANEKPLANPLLIEPPQPQAEEQTNILIVEHIQKEISRLWRPPVGVPKGTECTVRFTVTKKGKVHHFNFLKRSEIVIYDLSVTRIAHKFSFDKSLWGKTFTIDFRQ